jgi:hypothetical protein
MTTCPHCSHQMDDAPELAGQFVACPLCGGQFPLPLLPAPPIAGTIQAPSSQSPQPIPTGLLVSNSVSEIRIDTDRAVSVTRHGVAKHYHAAKSSPTKFPKFLLLVATIAWPIAALGWGQVQYSLEMGKGEKIAGADLYMVVYVGGRRDVITGDLMRLHADNAWQAGLIHVTVLYGFTALLCLAWWFYAKD